MSSSDIKYMPTHEWIAVQQDGVARVGISDYAQEQLGDVVYIELPEVGAVLQAGDVAGVVESVKAASDIYAPVNGEVVAINTELDAAPELLNSSAEAEGWLYCIRLADPDSLDALMDGARYAEFIKENQ